MSKLDFKLDQAPKNIPVDVYYPDGTLLITTDNDLIFDYVRNIICDNQVEGFYVIFKGERYDILPSGRINNWPYGMFDTYQYLLARLCRIGFNEENKSKTSIWQDLYSRNKQINNAHK